VVEAGERFAAFVNLEIPGAGPDDVRAVAYTPTIEAALRSTAIDELYPVCVGMEMVPALFGGVVPTDIQGAYRWGIPGTSTACDSPWYHTRADTPDKVDLAFLARAALRWRRMIANLDSAAAETLLAPDPHLWTLEIGTTQSSAGLLLEVRARRPGGDPAAGAQVQVWLDVDDFTRAFRADVRTDASGVARVTVPGDALQRGGGGKYVHVTAGESWPLVERILPLH
jgi:hypothetical protein